MSLCLSSLPQFYLLIHIIFVFLFNRKTLVFFRSPGKFFRHAAGCAADLVHEPGVAGPDGAPALAPPHGAEHEVEEREGRGGGVLQ